MKKVYIVKIYEGFYVVKRFVESMKERAELIAAAAIDLGYDAHVEESIVS